MYSNMGAVPRNNFIMFDQLAQVAPTQVNDPAAKLYLLSMDDQKGGQTLQQTFPQGRLTTYTSQTPGKDFQVFFVPPSAPKR